MLASNPVFLFVVSSVVLVGLGLFIVRYKRCPEGQLLVVYGAYLPEGFVILDSGGRFVLPIVQQSAYVSLAKIELSERNGAGLPRAVRVGTTSKLRRNAAIQLVGLSDQEIVARVLESLDQSSSTVGSVAERLSELGLEVA